MIEPDRADLRVERAELLLRVGKPKAALSDVAKLTRVTEGQGADPGIRRRALRVRGMARLALGDAAAAEQALTRLLTEGVDDGKLREALARALDRQGKNSLEHWQKAMRAAATVERVLGLGKILERLGELNRSAEVYERGLEQLSGAAVIRVALVDALIRLGRTDRALVLIEEQLQRQKVKAAWLIRKGDALQAAGKPKEASAAWRRAETELVDRSSRRPSAMLHRQLREIRARLGAE